jgi:hypothetical protein
MRLQIDQVNLSFLQVMWQALLDFLPKIFAAIAVLFIGWILMKLITFLVKKALKFTKIDSWTDKLNEIEIFENSDFQFKPANFIVKAVKWILVFVLIIIVSDILGLQMISQEIGNLIRYLPKLFSAIAILMIGIYIANIIRNAIKLLFKSFDLGGSTIIGNIVFYAILLIITITALNQAGINTDIITNNLTIILGSLLFAFTIAFGLGSKEIVQRLLFGFYSRKNLTIGQRIRIGEVQGTIDAINNISLVLKTNEGKFIFPIKEVNDRIIKVLDN